MQRLGDIEGATKARKSWHICGIDLKAVPVKHAAGAHRKTPPMPTILLLIASNCFMTIAWHWHLKGGMTKPIVAVVLISWGIALFEYCLAVPANWLGYPSRRLQKRR
jgi:hypothetical protein